MRGTEMNTNDSSTKALAELNPHMLDHQKESSDRVEDERRINDRENANGNGGFAELIQDEAIQGRQPQGPMVQWDQFLPFRTLKILLVENNDSTRHLLSALLRNCGYEVVPVRNGLEAWKILEDPTNHIDLVLTEVVMPCLSGIGLLSKIKRHKVSKHIPVIMMSSNDSMGTVIKCLSKGAIDFLVKPIRKNELKNLWQHVWRKCRSFSGSGNESGIRTQNLMKSKGVEGLENNTSSNNDNENGSIGLNFKDESDNGSGTQNSWSKRVVEVDRHQPTLVSDQLADPHDNTHAQDELEHVGMGQDLEIGIPRSPDLRLEDANEKVLKNVMEKEKLELDGEPMNGKRRNKAAEFTLHNVTNCTKHQTENVANELSKISNTEDRAIYVNNELSSLELRLKRQRVEGDAQERNVLRHSGLSAFTRYKDDMGSMRDHVFTKLEASNDVAIPAATMKADRPDTATVNAVLAQAKAVHQQVQVQHHHHYYHHHHHHVHNMPKQQELSNHDDLSDFRPSNVLTGPNEGKAANYTTYSLSGSGSGSVNRSNGEYGSSSNAPMPEIMGGNSGGADGSGTWSRGGVDQNRLTQREAALYKFRQKKRDRCFGKKVRYQNRKKLAEQRPRVRGQFVRQATNENEGKDTNS